MEQFYIVLPSSERVKGNTPSNYSIPLSTPISLKNATYSLRLAEFFFRKSWLNVATGDNVFYVKIKSFFVYKIHIPPGFYNTVDSLLNVMNSKIDAVTDQKDGPKFE